MGNVSINVMGAVEVSDGASVQRPSGPLQRLLLALLAANGPRWLPASTLSEALWPAQDPTVAGPRLHLHIHRLRTKVGPAAIQSGPDGYRLALATDAVDVWQFEHLVTGALTAHHDGGDEVQLLDWLERAASLWTGMPYADVDHPVVDIQRHRLVELHLLAEETRVQHRLDRDEHRTVLDFLIPLARAHPTRERLQTLWMTVLYRSGEHSQAIEVYERTRGVLEEDLGMSPGSGLRAIHALVLNASAGEDPEPPGGGPKRARTTGATYQEREQSAPTPERTIGSTHAVGRERDTQEAALRTDLAEAPAGEDRAALQHSLGLLLASTSQLAEAQLLLIDAETYYRVTADTTRYRDALLDLAVVVSTTGDLRRSERLLAEARHTCPGAAKDVRLALAQATVLAHMKVAAPGRQLMEQVGRPTAATEPIQASMWWRARSLLDRREGRVEQAISAARTALALAGSAGANAAQILVMVDLACALRDAGEDEAATWYRAAARYATRLGCLPLLALAEASLAKASLLTGDAGHATVHAREALRHARACGAWGLAGRSSQRLADAADLLGEPMRAAWYRHESLAHYRRVDYPLTDLEHARQIRLLTRPGRQLPAPV